MPVLRYARSRTSTHYFRRCSLFYQPDATLSLMRSRILLLLSALTAALFAQPVAPDWTKLNQEALKHFQALVRIDTQDPPGFEQPAVEYLKGVLEAEGIPVKIFALDPKRPNLVARLK